MVATSVSLEIKRVSLKLTRVMDHQVANGKRVNKLYYVVSKNVSLPLSKNERKLYFSELYKRIIMFVYHFV